jgi:hypothetical protein
MTDYTWTIATCEHDIATGGITVAHWRCSAVDGITRSQHMARLASPLTHQQKASSHMQASLRQMCLAGCGLKSTKVRCKPNWRQRLKRRKTR